VPPRAQAGVLGTPIPGTLAAPIAAQQVKAKVGPGKVVEAHEEPFLIPTGGGLRRHIALLPNQHSVKVALLDDEDPAGPQYAAEIRQRGGERGRVRQVRDGVPQAEERIVWPTEVLCESPKAENLEAGCHALLGGQFPGARDHPRTDIHAGHAVAVPRQRHRVLPSATSHVQHRMRPSGTQLLLQPGEFVGQAGRPVDEHVIVHAQGIVEVGRTRHVPDLSRGSGPAGNACRSTDSARQSGRGAILHLPRSRRSESNVAP